MVVIQVRDTGGLNGDSDSEDEKKWTHFKMLFNVISEFLSILILRNSQGSP